MVVRQNPKIQIRCVDSKNQLAGILTEGHFARDEWNHLLYVFSISLVSSQGLLLELRGSITCLDVRDASTSSEGAGEIQVERTPPTGSCVRPVEAKLRGRAREMTSPLQE